MKSKTREYAFWGILFLIILLVFYLIYWINTEPYECISDPYGYSIRLLEKTNEAEVTAIVTVHKPNSVLVLWTKDGFSKIEKEFSHINYTIPMFNFTK